MAFLLSHGGDVKADGNCLFTVTEKAIGAEIDTKEPRRRTMRRFLEDFDRSGGLEVKLLGTKASRKVQTFTINELTALGLQRIVMIFGLEEDRNQHGKLIESMWNNMPGYLEEFVGKMMSDSNESKIKCVITDWTMAWALKVAAKMGIPRAAFWSSSAAILASLLHLPKLIEDKIVNDNGVPYINNQMIKLSPSMPTMSTNQLVWMCMGKTNMQQEVFDLFIRINVK